MSQTCANPSTRSFQHLDPEIWNNINFSEGEQASKEDASRFRPSRFVNPPGSQQPLFQPPKGTFVPWYVHPRIQVPLIFKRYVLIIHPT